MKNAEQLHKMFTKINADISSSGHPEEYVPLTNHEYYAQQIHNLFEESIPFEKARRLANEVALIEYELRTSGLSIFQHIEDMLKKLEFMIHYTPTSEVRNFLTDANIGLMSAKIAIERMSIQSQRDAEELYGKEIPNPKDII